MKIPSVKTLSLICPDQDLEIAKKVRKILDGTIDPADVLSGHHIWDYAASPNRLEMRMLACDKLIENHGIESFWLKPGELIYSNSGDMYAPTLCYVSWYVNPWVVSDVGYYAERWPEAEGEF